MTATTMPTTMPKTMPKTTDRGAGPAQAGLAGRQVVLVLVLVLQLACTLFFVSDILFSVLGLRTRPISWQLRELLEIGAALGLITGLALGALLLRAALRQSRRAERALRTAQGAFTEILEERFDEWGLTPAERDVALFSVKGLSIGEIATMRATSDGTVKAQAAAIYRKAGVSGRPQLLSLFIDELMDGGLPSGR